MKFIRKITCEDITTEYYANEAGDGLFAKFRNRIGDMEYRQIVGTFQHPCDSLYNTIQFFKKGLSTPFILDCTDTEAFTVRGRTVFELEGQLNG